MKASGESSASAVAVTPSGGDYVVAGESWPEPRGNVAGAGGANATPAERTVGANSTLAVAEFTSEGKLDTSFATAGGTPGVLEYEAQTGETPPTSTSAAGVAVQPDGTILVVGTEQLSGSGEPALLVDRIASEGGGQEPFSLQVEGQPTEGDAIAAGPDGTIYVAATENPGTSRAKAVIAQLVETPLPLGPLFAAGATRVLAQTAPYDHCNFTILDGAPAGLVERFRALLLGMSYADPETRPLMDMEGLKAWMPGRVEGYAQLERAVDRFGTLAGWLAKVAA